MKDLVSIITPTFNRAYILSNAVKSVLSQTYINWELFIVDDGSSDNTKSLIRTFKDSRINYLYQEHKGQGATRNIGLEKARGKWISYIDSDNEFLPNYLETVLYMLKQYPEALYALPKSHRTLELYKGNKMIQCIDDSKDIPSNLTVKDIFMRKLHFDLNGFIHSRKIVDEGIRFDEKLPAMEDWDFALSIGERFPNNFLFIPKKLYNYHQRYGGDGVVSNTPYKKWAEIFEYIYQKHKNDNLMVGQTWYPDRVRKWTKIAKDYKKGLMPPPYLYHFNRATFDRRRSIYKIF